MKRKARIVTPREYWTECVSSALEEAGISATEEQIASVADSVAAGHECFGMAFGHDVASSNLAARSARERDEVARQIELEKQKVGCPECRGAGRRKYTIGMLAVNAHCSRCNGTGKVHP